MKHCIGFLFLWIVLVHFTSSKVSRRERGEQCCNVILKSVLLVSQVKGTNRNERIRSDNRKIGEVQRQVGGSNVVSFFLRQRTYILISICIHTAQYYFTPYQPSEQRQLNYFKSLVQSNSDFLHQSYEFFFFLLLISPTKP